ncbi:Sphingosine kinase 2 [Entomortierella chlamydospora]|uniref:Sphingosine kinase 2 n=1 Tax=Entomortierella chlamydospora TaxID=101097 RepID=A0A9P6MSS4_9FUNG|nr:Sphingosine kinase 2 [Entomortierella chlamydospora]
MGIVSVLSNTIGVLALDYLSKCRNYGIVGSGYFQQVRWYSRGFRRNAQIEYTSALEFIKSISSNLKPKVIRVSPMGGPEGGIDQASYRNNQHKIWILNKDPHIQEMASELEFKVLRNEVMSGEATHKIVERFPYCCIYGYNAPNKSVLESSVQDSSQDQLFTLHYVKFTSLDLKAVSSPKLARIYLLFDQQPDVKRFLALTEQLGDTEYGKHAVDIAHKVDLKELDTLIVISGDGVLHEIINGLLTRPDWDQARHLPIGIIPAGSGNAIATSIGTRNPIVATLAVIRGETSKLDIFSLSQLDRPRIYSMLMFSWGMMADADIESDKYVLS